MKQTTDNKETLQDAATEYSDLLFKSNSVHKDACKQDFKAGANWQAAQDKETVDKLIEALKRIAKHTTANKNVGEKLLTIKDIAVTTLQSLSKEE